MTSPAPRSVTFLEAHFPSRRFQNETLTCFRKEHSARCTRASSAQRNPRGWTELRCHWEGPPGLPIEFSLSSSPSTPAHATCVYSGIQSERAAVSELLLVSLHIVKHKDSKRDPHPGPPRAHPAGPGGGQGSASLWSSHGVTLFPPEDSAQPDPHTRASSLFPPRPEVTWAGVRVPCGRGEGERGPRSRSVPERGGHVPRPSGAPRAQRLW